MKKWKNLLEGKDKRTNISITRGCIVAGTTQEDSTIEEMTKMINWGGFQNENSGRSYKKINEAKKHT